MAEIPITAAVGASPSPNRPDDVRTVQDLLTRAQPPLAGNVAVTGVMDRVTLDAIREFQHRFMANPDGKVTPDDRTIFHLNNGSVPLYPGLSPNQRLIIDHDLINAQNWLSHVNSRLTNPFDGDMKQKVLNVFHVSVDNPAPANAFRDLRDRFSRLRASLNAPFPLEFAPGNWLELAWVDPNDPVVGTMHFPAKYFGANQVSRIEKIIHERAHTVFVIQHDGMLARGEIVDFRAFSL